MILRVFTYIVIRDAPDLKFNFSSFIRAALHPDKSCQCFFIYSFIPFPADDGNKAAGCGVEFNKNLSIMRNPHYIPNDLIELLNIVDTAAIIATMQKGVEVQKLELAANPNDKDLSRALRHSRALLSFLYSRQLGLH